jgi:hypothetical protein
VDLPAAVQSPIDLGYALLNWGSSQLGTGIWLVNLVCAALLVWGLWKVAVRQPNPWLVFVVAVPYLIIVVGMGYTRQAAAIGLAMVATSAFLEKRWWAFMFAMVGAAMFHQTAIILLPIFALSLSTNRYFSIAMILAVALILFQFLITEEEVSRMTEYYVTEEMKSQGAWVRVGMNVLPALLFLIKQRHFGFSDQERKLWRNISLCALLALVTLVIFDWSTLVDRLSLYFLMLQVVILGRLPWAIARESRDQLLLIAGVIMYSLAIQFVWLNYAVHAEFWIPYKTTLFS